MKKTCRGACHCGRVRFTAELDLAESIVCDCSICKKKGNIANRIEPADFHLETDLDDLSVYRFNRKTARHYFCPVCGVHPFHRPRSKPELWAVNVRCLDDVDIDTVPARQVFGSRLD